MLCHACPNSPPQPQMDTANNEKESKGVRIHIIGGRLGVWGFCDFSQRRRQSGHISVLPSVICLEVEENWTLLRGTQDKDENKRQDENSHT